MKEDFFYKSSNKAKREHSIETQSSTAGARRPSRLFWEVFSKKFLMLFQIVIVIRERERKKREGKDRPVVVDD